MDKNTLNMVIMVVVAVMLYNFFFGKKYEGYERNVTGGSYGKVQDEIFWYPYPGQRYPPGARHSREDLLKRPLSLSYVHPNIRMDSKCSAMGCGPNFRGENVNCYKCNSMKAQDSGR